jgi:hypothetical protein
MRIVSGQLTPPEQRQRLSVDQSEWELVWALRDVPAGPRKDILTQLLRDIVSFVGEPGCAESQADGVPCSSPSTDCAKCRRVDSCLALLHETLHFR